VGRQPNCRPGRGRQAKVHLPGWAEFAAQRVVSQEESLRRSAEAEATNALLRAVPVLDAPLPASWWGSAGRVGGVDGRALGDALVMGVARSEARRGRVGVATDVRRDGHGAGVRNARASLVDARRRGVAALALVPQGAGVFVSSGVLHAGARQVAGAKRRLEEAQAGEAEPLRKQLTRGQRMAGLAVVAAERSIL
jgi:hypothetical protein